MEKLSIIDPKEYGIEETKALSIEKSFEPKKIELTAFTQQYADVVAMELNKDGFKAARELRLKLVKVRTGIADVHKSEKAFFLASGKFVDALKNKLTTPIEQMEEKLSEIERHEERIEAERKASLKKEREAAFLPYEFDTSFLPLSEMSEEQFNGQLQSAKAAFEANKIAKEQAEAARIEAEKAQEEARIAKQKADDEERQRIQAENERLMKENEQKAIIRSNRSKELQPYIVFIRDYNALIEKQEIDYQNELSDIKKGAEDHWAYEIQQRKDEADRKEAERKEFEENERKRIAAEKELSDKKEAEQKSLEEEKAAIEKELSKGDAAKVKDLLSDLESLKTKYVFKSNKNKKMYSDVNQLLDKVIHHIKG